MTGRDMPERGNRAYQVDDGECSTVVFARHAATARRQGASDLNTEFESVETCRRAPQFDGYAEQGFVPAEALIDHGWWLECSGCNQRITSDAEDDEGKPLDLVFDNRDVWCSASCRDSERRARDRERRGKAAIPRYMRRFWPRVTYHSCHVAQFGSRIDRCAVAYFTFPGGEGRAEVTIRVTPRDSRQKGQVMLERRDLGAWSAFNAPLPSVPR
jgi:hypothetical protein